MAKGRQNSKRLEFYFQALGISERQAREKKKKQIHHRVVRQWIVCF